MSSADVALDRRRALAARMLRGEAPLPGREAHGIGPRADGARVPLSPAQRQVWLHAGLAPDQPIYNESITLHRRGPCDPAAMRAALDALVARHESWRSGVALDGGEPVLRILPVARPDFTIHDLSHLSPDERDAAAVAIATADARRPFDLSAPPLIRAHLVRLADDDHRLFLTLHHIVFDGVAIYRVVLPEFVALYDAFAAGIPDPLPPPPIGYGDYAVWAVGRPVPARQGAYWRETLAGFPGKLALPADRPVPAVRTHVGSMEVFHLEAPLVDALRALGSQAGATLYMVLLAGFSALLHLHTGAEDVTVGAVTDLRRRPELDRTVGYFLNTLPLRTRPCAAMGFLDYLIGVRETLLGALASSDLPFDEIVRTTGLRGAPGEHPLFDVLFSVEPPVEPFPPGWDLTQMDVVVGGAKYDLYLELDERPDGMAGRMLFGTERFDPATIRRLIGQWRTILDAITADPARSLATLLDAWPRARVLVGPAGPAPSGGATAAARIAARACATPDALAVRGGEEAWTYGELDRAADAIAARLHATGVGPGALVAVLLERSPLLVAALLAVWRAGAAFLPLDPRQPVARLRQIVSQAEVNGLVTERALVGLLGDDEPATVIADDPAEPSASPPDAEPSSGDLAYVLYTSGSTGEPKGVEVGHRALANLLAAMADRPGFAASDRLLALTTVSFDIALLELFLPLAAGGELVLVPFDVLRDPARLRLLVEAVRPTVMQATPAGWTALLEAGWTGDPGLRLLCGGEALPRTLADRLLPCGAELWNLYGPTETCIWSACARIEPGPAPVPIGTPIAHTRLALLDAAGAPVPEGIAGELWIGGAGLGHGYRGRPDLTADRFRTGPGGERFYRTGDRVRDLGPAGLLHLGRVDGEEKIRGFRVAVEEVEGVLAAHPDIAAAAVRSWPDTSGARVLAAYLVPRGALPSRAELATFVAKRLPDYMVPGFFQPIDALPLTASGKIDRGSLPRPTADAARSAFMPPETEDERRLAAIWSELLDLPAIGREDDFFELGGHSLLAARLLARVAADWRQEIGMPALLRARRLRDLARRLAEPPNPAHQAIPVQPRGWRPPLLWIEPSLEFMRVAPLVGRDQPILGVPLGIAEAEAGEPNDLAHHAARLVDAIRAIQPHGPYYLGGWCNVGLLAFAAAAQMEAEGDEIRLLALGDAMNPVFRHPRQSRFAVRLAFAWKQTLKRRWRDMPAYLLHRARRPIHRLLRKGRAIGWAPHEPFGRLDRAVAAYRPDRLAAPVLLFQAADAFIRPRMDRQWADRLTGPTCFRELPGDHDTLWLEPQAQAVADMLREALVEAQAGRPATAVA